MSSRPAPVDRNVRGGFHLIAVVYVNMVKCVAEWTTERTAGGGSFRCVPEIMKMPFIESVAFSARTWFNLAWFFLAVCILLLLLVHMRRRLSFIPASALGKGQLLYLAFL